MRTSNPTLNADTFQRFDRQASGNQMTVSGTVNKTGALLLLLIVSASITWNMIATGTVSPMACTLGGLIGGLLIAVVTCFKKTWAPVTAPLYAIVEGLFVGGVSIVYANMVGAQGISGTGDSIVTQAVLLTFGVLFSMLAAYRFGIIKATAKFRAGVIAATGGIMLCYLIAIVLGFFGINVPHLHEATPLGIGISVAIIIIAALNLILDFDLIETGANQGAPKYMEWFGAFALIVTLIWLYIEILRLLAMLANRRD
jgi:uncharacterized YccA/Bax inhibitor family protein